jgi:hypothetical protein
MEFRRPAFINGAASIFQHGRRDSAAIVSGQTGRAGGGRLKELNVDHTISSWRRGESPKMTLKIQFAPTWLQFAQAFTSTRA